MPQQGPILVVSDDTAQIDAALADVKSFPLLQVSWADAEDALTRLSPAAVIVSDAGAHEVQLEILSRCAGASDIYTPLIAYQRPDQAIGANEAMSFSPSGSRSDRLVARLNAALRVRSLHATALRRSGGNLSKQLPQTDPLHEATALLVGRSGSYASLSVELGGRMGVLGALSIEIAAKHLNARDIDGVIVAEGFSARVIDAFLTVLSEDARFRNLPVLLSASVGLVADYDLPNLEIAGNDLIAARAAPLIRQHAFEARLTRLMKSIDAGGILDPRSGLLTADAFASDLKAAVADAQKRGAGLSLVRMTLDSVTERHAVDAARIVGRMMRRMDFATLQRDGIMMIVLAETDARDAHMIARRITSVLKQTVTGPRGAPRIDPRVSVVSIAADDDAQALLARLDHTAQRAAS